MSDARLRELALSIISPHAATKVSDPWHNTSIELAHGYISLLDAKDAAETERDGLRAQIRGREALHQGLGLDGHELAVETSRRLAGQAIAAERRAETAERELARARRLINVMLTEDPNADAADGVTVLDVWRKEAAALGEAGGGG